MNVATHRIHTFSDFLCEWNVLAQTPCRSLKAVFQTKDVDVNFLLFHERDDYDPHRQPARSGGVYGYPMIHKNLFQPRLANGIQSRAQEKLLQIYDRTLKWTSYWWTENVRPETVAGAGRRGRKNAYFCLIVSEKTKPAEFVKDMEEKPGSCTQIARRR